MDPEKFGSGGENNNDIGLNPMAGPAGAGLSTSTESLQHEPGSPSLHDITASTSHLPLAPKEDGEKRRSKGRFDKTFEEEKSGPKHALVYVNNSLSRCVSVLIGCRCSDLSQIELRAEDLYDKDKVDIEQVEMEDVWQLLK
jgi:hypothetical protein